MASPARILRFQTMAREETLGDKSKERVFGEVGGN